jgi:hypothetical protein
MSPTLLEIVKVDFNSITGTSTSFSLNRPEPLS